MSRSRRSELSLLLRTLDSRSPSSDSLDMTKISLIPFIFCLSLFADPVTCFKAGKADPMNVLYTSEILKLCSGATGTAPLECYKTGLKDKETEELYRSELINLCSGAINLGPLECYKDAKKDSEVSEKVNLTYRVILCAGAESVDPVSCYKIARKDTVVSQELYTAELVKLCSKRP